MCDYSLAHYPNRLAVEFEQLQVYRFSSGTVGLVSEGPSHESPLPTAVCVPPGAKLLLRDIPQPLQKQLSVSEIEVVLFIEQTLEPYTHRDAVRFANGREVLLQRLASGQRVDVLRLSGAPEEAEDLHDRKQEPQPDREVVAR
jgi:hypothetical protein